MHAFAADHDHHRDHYGLAVVVAVEWAVQLDQAAAAAAGTVFDSERQVVGIAVLVVAVAGG